MPGLRQGGKWPFGLCACIIRFRLVGVVAAFDFRRLGCGFSSLVLLQIAAYFPGASSLSGLPRLLFRDADVLAFINVVIIFVVVFTAVGLWFRRRQAWVTAMVLIGIGLVYNIWNYLEGTPLYVNMLINVFAVFYLNERGVQAYFEQRSAGEEARL